MRDREEALRRFQELLQAEEETKPLPKVEQPEQPLVYRNFANNYGADIRNFANNYGADSRYPGSPPAAALSQPESREKPLWPWILADSLLLAAITGILIWWAVMAAGGAA